MKTLTFDIEGMTCNGCVSSVKTALAKVDGVRAVDVSLAPGKATLQADLSIAAAAIIQATIGRLGYRATLRPGQEQGAST